MTSRDEDAAFWRSESGVAEWLVVQQERDRVRAAPRRFLAELLPFGREDAVVVADLGAGTGAAARAVLDAYPAARAVLVDFSPAMGAARAAAMAPYAGRYAYADVDLAAPGPWPAAVPAHLDAVVTSMFLHHLPDDGKRRLVAEATARLAPGGWLLDLDLVTAPDPAVEETWTRVSARIDPHGAAEGGHPPGHGPGPHSLHVSSLTARLALLRGAGLEAVDAYWKQLDTVITGGRRPR